MRKCGGTPSRREMFPTPAATSSPGSARDRFVGGHKSGLAGCKLPRLFKCRPSSYTVTGVTPGATTGRLSMTDCTYLPTYLPRGVPVCTANPE